MKHFRVTHTYDDTAHRPTHTQTDIYLPPKLRLILTSPCELLMNAPHGTTDTSSSICCTVTASLLSSLTLI